MSPYLLAGPAVALIGIVAVMFVMRHRSTEKRSMYSSRRSRMEHKVKAARSRTLAPHGRSGRAPTADEIAAAAPVAPVYQAPVAPRQAWEVGPATSAPAYAAPPAAAPPAYRPSAYPPPAAPAEPFAPAPVKEPSWTPAPAEPSWNPSPAPPVSSPTPAAPSLAPQPASTPAGEGASWEIVGDAKVATAQEPTRKGKDKKKGKQAAATGSPWQLASGEAATEEGAAEEAKAPNPVMAIAQYAVIVVGLLMVLIGVLIMVANSKVT